MIPAVSPRPSCLRALCQSISAQSSSPAASIYHPPRPFSAWCTFTVFSCNRNAATFTFGLRREMIAAPLYRSHSRGEEGGVCYYRNGKHLLRIKLRFLTMNFTLNLLKRIRLQGRGSRWVYTQSEKQNKTSSW